MDNPYAAPAEDSCSCHRFNWQQWMESVIYYIMALGLVLLYCCIVAAGVYAVSYCVVNRIGYAWMAWIGGFLVGKTLQRFIARD